MLMLLLAPRFLAVKMVVVYSNAAERGQGERERHSQNCCTSAVLQ